MYKLIMHVKRNKRLEDNAGLTAVNWMAIKNSLPFPGGNGGE